jgi:hypothetical protein
MDNDLFEIVNILNDNNYIENVDEEFDKKVSDMLNTVSLDEEISVKHDGNPFYVELNGYSDPNDLDIYLERCFNQFKKVAVEIKLNKNKLLQDAISQRIISIREELLKLKNNTKCKRYRNYLSLFEIKIKYCDKILGFLSNIKIETLKLSGKKIGDNTALTQKRVSILFYYLQKIGYAGKNMETDDFTKLVAEITGYSSEQIRQDFSHIKKISSEDYYGFQLVDFEKVISYLRVMINNMEEDSKIKFPTKK